MSMQFKDNLKELMIEKGFTQKSLANAIGTTQGTISKWLSGVQEPRLYQLKQICAVFGCTADFLIGNDNALD